MAFGLTAAAHAVKLPAWTLRLEGATAALEQALASGDRAAILAQFEDVWFWLGRVLCDGFSVRASDLPPGLPRRIPQAILRAYSATQRAHRVLARR